MKLLKPGDPCPCCGNPLPEGLPTEIMNLLGWMADRSDRCSETEENDKMKEERNMEHENSKNCLRDVPAGECVKIGEWEFAVLEQMDEGTAVILKDLLIEKKEFGRKNNYDGSYVDRSCREFAEKLIAAVGDDCLVEHEVDLTSDDGLKDYGSVRRTVSLLTADRYRKYVEILDRWNPRKWWWLATAWSTPRHGSSYGVKCVAPSGLIYGVYCYDGLGVRPFCIFKSEIFVSI